MTDISPLVLAPHSTRHRESTHDLDSLIWVSSEVVWPSSSPERIKRVGGHVWRERSLDRRQKDARSRSCCVCNMDNVRERLHWRFCQDCLVAPVSRADDAADTGQHCFDSVDAPLKV